MRKRSFESNILRIQAEERSKAKTNLLSNMSHDIRTPMNAIIGYTALAKDPSAGIDEIRDYLDKIDASSNHLLELIDDILEMSSIEAGKMELGESETDICRLVMDAADMFRQQMETKGIRFRADVSEVNNRFVLCDKSKMNRVLLNLLSNAYKFTPGNGSVTVSLKEYGETGPDNSASYTLRVKDTGIGMSEEFAKHVFDAFERERSSTVSRIQGTGLGMSITKRFIDMMGGTISVRSKQNAGTEFVIKLWLKLSAADTQDGMQTEIQGTDTGNGSELSGSPFAGYKLLLVDDMDINREMAKRILIKLGFDVETAENGKEAVEYVTNSHPGDIDIILMDIQMPEMNGYEATAKIRGLSNKNLSAIPIVALTADAFESDIRAASEAGMDGHISKPLNIRTMIKEINRVLKR